MREVLLDSKKERPYGLLIWLLIFLVGVGLGLMRLDNTFWYKSATLAYLLASILYLSTLLLRDRNLHLLASLGLSLGLLLNLAGMVRRTIQTYELGVPHPPWSNLFEALTFWSFVVGAIYLFLERKYGVRLLGAVVVPVVFGLSAFAVLYASKDIVPLMPALRSYWLYVHVVTAFVGYAGFTVGFGGAVLYLLKEKFPQLLLPSKEILDEITYKSIVIVFPIWTASIILGAAWANEAWGGYWSWDPKEVWSLIVWLFFGAYLHARQMLGWKGKRTAWMVVFGFITVLICFFAVNLFFPGLHSYATD
ncbi:MAG: c-type cytochrome biogenesis protein CcsB [Aquificaceae bacterium]|nr:c-type cytochrome biogenesis protein CcsB [Aquificaceae bacterium]MCX7989138.1 c-type cytochrome biogenesis protein CcsB [Aquificaceae bacterium]